jgi:type I restriction enzyme M protein
MLTQEIKKKIDSARSVLVGKVPDPKAQVEQITTALIYKFMDDMDMQAASLPKGKAHFFTNGFEKYAWSKMMDAKLGGQERLNLYVEAIAKMAKNPHLPQLFREVFKDAFLPYRDPETLNLFLKDINTFSYDHSENLGDAFEYLLSILGSQGDAGQFRTPRHIIDFIVEVVDPRKDETILDPACGTAGFLISAYKHILKVNKDKPLTPDEKKHLMGNLSGYDISPDMVKLSLVNMYLHGFPDPNIHEYDTLASEERWDERYDVMMANPPFMTPKGGIRPHKRFMVQANRSEVLFVDYIMEHLNNKGRAGIIVPEGVISRDDNAYKQLRKLLVQDGLYAVVSLPGGVFNPYSGVTTYILLFDNQLTKLSKEILFIKIFNDGFDLGAQRKPIDKNDLPQAIEILRAQRDAIETRTKNLLLKNNSQVAWEVSKTKILESEDYNLSGKKHKDDVALARKGWGTTTLGEVAIVGSGNSAPQGDRYFKNGTEYFFRTSDVGKVHISGNLVESRDKINVEAIKEMKLTKFQKSTILFPKSGASTFLNHRAMLGVDGYVSSHLATIIADEKKVMPKFLFYLLCSIDARTLTPDQAYPSLKLSSIGKIKIPLPPIAIQKQIIAEIESNEKEIKALEGEIESRGQKVTSKIAEIWGE